MTTPHERFIIELQQLLLTHFDKEQSILYCIQFADICLKSAIKLAEQENIPFNWKNQYFCSLYGAKCYIILQHLDVNSRVNDYTVINALKAGTSVEEIMSWPIHKLAPAASQKVRDLLHKQANVEVHVNITKLYKCPNKTCGAHNARYRVAQVRSADEPATTFLCCVECGKEWRL